MSPASPQLKPLSIGNRRFVFISMLLMFVVLVPLLVLYATGYRFNLLNISDTFRVVGGLYISTDVTDANIVLNDEPVDDVRIFQRAAYIQNVPAGVHEVYVEAPGVTTWVKDLPVFAHLVTEARSFNLPLVPQVRVITPWLHATSGASVLFESATSTPFTFASTSNTFFVATSTATSSYQVNAEHSFVTSLFGTSTTKSRVQLIEEQFSFNQSSSTDATSTATTTKLVDNTQLFESGGEVYARWLGEARSIPYYYCVNYQGATSTATLYGDHVYKQLAAELASSTVSLLDLDRNEMLCRRTIRIDRSFQTVHWFDFVPGNRDLVLMLLDRGLYIVEIDDRAWQNVQLLYPGDDLTVEVNSGRIYVRDGEYVLQVYTELQE